jgi:hypothetical protein
VNGGCFNKFHYITFIVDVVHILVEQNTLKNVNNCLNTNFYSYLETSGACIIKLIMVVIHGFGNKLRVFVPGKPFQPSLVLGTNALAYHGNCKLRP